MDGHEDTQITWQDASAVKGRCVEKKELAADDFVEVQSVLAAITGEPQLGDGSQCPGGHGQTNVSVQLWNPDPLSLHVGKLALLGLMVRVGNFVSNQRTFSTYFTSARHLSYLDRMGSIPPLVRGRALVADRS